MQTLALAMASAFLLTVWTVTAQDPVDEIRQLLEDYGETVETLKGTVRDLARQTMLQQLFVEERIRSDGDSGVKIVRGQFNGPQNYYSPSHVGGSFDSIHDHSNYDRTVGMGEVIAVLNGVEFRTRHNDYKLRMPSTTSTEYHDTEKLPFPGVPEAVTNKTTVDVMCPKSDYKFLFEDWDQIEELRLWFKAFKDQDYSVRDYRKFFKAALCYMEGAWTLDTELDEPFQSDRHQIDADSWFQLQELVRYASYTGTKSRLENFAYLPTSIMSVNKTTGLPNYAQWNYRILCSPIQEDIPLAYIKQMDDLSHRYPRGKELDDVTLSRGARFQLYEYDKPKFEKYNLIDRIFYTIPGKDNIPGKLTQDTFGEKMYDMGSNGNVDLNTGYYHRWFRFSKAGAMGLSTVRRGFNDANLWVAQTTQNRVAPIGYEQCSKQKVPGKRKKVEVCNTDWTRFSYAIPLEIVYLTPLLSWNPYDLEINEKRGIATANGRNGRSPESKAYNGTDYSHYYLTPIQFFEGRTDRSDPADTVRNSVNVLDKKGVMRQTTASGTRIVLQDIEGVGKVRLRFPMAPVHGEGSSVWKELNALKDMFLESVAVDNSDAPTNVHFSMSTTLQDPPGEHNHEFDIPYASYRDMVDNSAEITVTTTENQGHSHVLVIRYIKRDKTFRYISCGSSSLCWDRHPRAVSLETENNQTEMGL